MNINSNEIKLILDNLEYNNLFKESDILQNKLIHAIENKYSSHKIENILYRFAKENNSNIKIAVKLKPGLFGVTLPKTNKLNIQMPTKPYNRLEHEYLVKLKLTNQITPAQKKLLDYYDGLDKLNLNQPGKIQNIPQHAITGMPPAQPKRLSPEEAFNKAIEDNNMQDVHAKVEAEVKKGTPRQKALLMLGLPLAAMALYNSLMGNFGIPENQPVTQQPEETPTTTTPATPPATQAVGIVPQINIPNLLRVDVLPETYAPQQEPNKYFMNPALYQPYT